MADDIAPVTQSMRELDMNEAAKRQSSHRERVHDAIEPLLLQTKAATTMAGGVATIIDRKTPLLAGDYDRVLSLMAICDSLAAAAHTLSDAILDFTVHRITSLGDADTTQKRLLFHFDSEIRETIRGKAVLWKAVEDCYNQSVSYDSGLHSSNYYVALDEAALGWSFDEDYESEEYYDHINRLEIDEDYGIAFQRQCEQRLDERRKRNDDWIGFWVTALHATPDGPTIFYLPASRAGDMDTHCGLLKLWRTFDGNSSGINTDRTIASVMSKYDTVGKSRVDVLRLPREQARTRLRGHLTKSLFGGDSWDNLMSWTSSPLFSIQYGIYRCKISCLDESEISFCILDPNEFPEGQFARNKALLQRYQNSAHETDGLDKFFGFPIGDARYDNGEYLSQGRVNISGRSCVVTLEQLRGAGLFKLYPELDESGSGQRWTNRVLELRRRWLHEQTTTTRDIETALQLAGQCFPRFAAVDMAIMFLAFKNRKLHDAAGPLQIYTELEKYGPIEVQRYLALTARAKLTGDSMRDKGRPTLSLDIEFIKGIFECAD